MNRFLKITLFLAVAFALVSVPGTHIASAQDATMSFWSRDSDKTLVR